MFKLNKVSTQDHASFNFVVVDGNRFPIPEHLMAQGSQGGQVTALHLRTLVEDSLRQSGFELSQYAGTRIVLFADLALAAQSYPQNDPPVLDFFTSFDRADCLTAFHEIDQTFVSRKDLESESSACSTLCNYRTDSFDSKSNACHSTLQSLLSKCHLPRVELGNVQIVLQPYGP